MSISIYFFFYNCRERLEAEQEKAAVVRQLAAHNHSRDSAIDTDMQEWETDILHLPIVSYKTHNRVTLNMSLKTKCITSLQLVHVKVKKKVSLIYFSCNNFQAFPMIFFFFFFFLPEILLSGCCI